MNTRLRVPGSNPASSTVALRGFQGSLCITGSASQIRYGYRYLLECREISTSFSIDKMMMGGPLTTVFLSLQNYISSYLECIKVFHIVNCHAN